MDTNPSSVQPDIPVKEGTVVDLSPISIQPQTFDEETAKTNPLVRPNIVAANITSSEIISGMIRSRPKGNFRLEMRAYNASFFPNSIVSVSSSEVDLSIIEFASNGNLSISTDYIGELNGDWRIADSLRPSTAGVQSLGDAVLYFNDVSYKTLTDRGCLGWFDDGVELQDGKKVSDMESLLNIQKHPTKKTIYGVPMLDYQTLPKVVYKKAELKGEVLPRDENDEPYWIDEKNNKRPASDGAELTSLISIMIGTIKELDNRLKKLEK